jgi:hypothetical protein
VKHHHTKSSSRNYSHSVEENIVQAKSKQPLPKQAGGKTRAELVMKCYKYDEGGHVSSNCPMRKFVSTTIHDGEDDKEYEHEEIGQDVCEEKGEDVVCMFQRLLCSTPQPDNTQRKKLFES